VRYLLDTHIALWATYRSRKLSAAARALLAAENIEVHVSAASLWEIAVKNAAQPGELPPVSQAITDFAKAGFRELPVTSRAMAFFERLPMLHKDPFDRMLVSQASTEGLTLLTADEKVSAYDSAKAFVTVV
jgi:PIN domain nuclease of toxin-antitoxin system